MIWVFSRKREVHNGRCYNECTQRNWAILTEQKHNWPTWDSNRSSMEYLKKAGALREYIMMKTYSHGPIDYAKS